MRRVMTAVVAALTLLIVPAVSVATAKPQSVVPDNLLRALGDQPAIWNDRGASGLTIGSSADVARSYGTVVALFTPGVEPADHDLGAASMLGEMEAAGIARPTSMPAGLSAALRRVPPGTDLTFAGIRAGTPGQVGIPGGTIASAGAAGGDDTEGCGDPDQCEYVWITTSIIGAGFKCYGPAVFGVCVPPSPSVPKYEYATTHNEEIRRNDGGSDTLTVSPIHFKDNRGDDWSRNFIVEVYSFNQPNAGAAYIGSSTGWWSPVNESIAIPPPASR